MEKINFYNNRFLSHTSIDSSRTSMWIIERNGQGLGCIYWYDDDDTTVYLDNLSVSNNSRRKGLGTILQEIRESIGKKLGAKFVCLLVKKDTWMHEWYERRGYSDYQDQVNEKEWIWMKKSLI